MFQKHKNPQKTFVFGVLLIFKKLQKSRKKYRREHTENIQRTKIIAKKIGDRCKGTFPCILTYIIGVNHED